MFQETKLHFYLACEAPVLRSTSWRSLAAVCIYCADNGTSGLTVLVGVSTSVVRGCEVSQVPPGGQVSASGVGTRSEGSGGRSSEKAAKDRSKVPAAEVDVALRPEVDWRWQTGGGLGNSNGDISTAPEIEEDSGDVDLKEGSIFLWYVVN